MREATRALEGRGSKPHESHRVLSRFVSAIRHTDERRRASALLGHDGEPEGLERELAAAIRSGALDDRSDDLRAHVRATVREKLLIANPGYLPDASST